MFGCDSFLNCYYIPLAVGASCLLYRFLPLDVYMISAIARLGNMAMNSWRKVSCLFINYYY